MPFGDDIVRGLRLGGFLLAFLFAGVAAYRIEKAPHARAEAVQVPDPPQLEPAKSAPKQQKRDLWSGPAIPPPPPAAHRGSTRPSPAPAPEPKLVEPEPAESTPPEAHVELPKPEPSVNTPTAGTGEESPAPAASEKKSDQFDSRAKRALKSVGRFLHIVHSDQN